MDERTKALVALLYEREQARRAAFREAVDAIQRETALFAATRIVNHARRQGRL